MSILDFPSDPTELTEKQLSFCFRTVVSLEPIQGQKSQR